MFSVDDVIVAILMDAGLQGKQAFFSFFADGSRFLQEIFYPFLQDVRCDVLNEISVLPDNPIRRFIAEVIIINMTITSF
jgi:hypothetical protein